MWLMTSTWNNTSEVLVKVKFLYAPTPSCFLWEMLACVLKSRCGMYGSIYVIAYIFQTSHWLNHFSGGNCGLWGSCGNFNQQILNSTEHKALFFALQLKSHNHLYPKETWAFNRFQEKLIIITFLCSIFHFKIAQSTLIHGIAFKPREIIFLLSCKAQTCTSSIVPCNLWPLQ